MNIQTAKVCVPWFSILSKKVIQISCRTSSFVVGMIYSLFYRHNSFEFFLYIILGQQLLFKHKHRYVVPIHGHLYRKLKREVSRTEKRLKITITSMFPRRRRRSRARKEWICERRCQVSVSGVVYMYFRDCFALKPFRDYSLCSVCILPQPAFYS